MSRERVCLAAVAGAHGVRGLVKLKAFTEAPEDALAYGPLEDEAGARRFDVTLKGKAGGKGGDLLLAAIAGIDSREAAEALRGTRLYVDRAALPEIEEEETFYQADLVGLAAVDREGAVRGRIKAVQNFGAGDLLEIEAPDGGSFFLAFTKEAVPEVDLAGGRLVIAPPEEIEARPEGKTGQTEESDDGSAA
ncbi:MAG: ribosome maturation factor RimM [Rhodovibrionaceae bacterium]